jgi:hypothetical protein
VRLEVLSAREAAIVAVLADTVAAPEPPLPPVGDTDTVAAFDRWLALAPRANRAALRGILLVAGRALRSRPRVARLAALEALHHSHTPGVRQLTEAVRALVSGCYFGDLEVMRALGYRPPVAP